MKDEYVMGNRTKEWLAGNIEPVFGFPRIVRFSWGTLEGYAHTLKEIQWHRQDDVRARNSTFVSFTFV